MRNWISDMNLHSFLKKIHRNCCINIVQRMMNFFGHVCKMEDDTLVAQVVLAHWTAKTTDRKTYCKKNIGGDLVDWCNEDICTLYGTTTLDKMKWIHFVKYDVDTNERE